MKAYSHQALKTLTIELARASVSHRRWHMKRIIEETNVSGLDALMGEQVLLLCGNYFYAGKLTGVNKTLVELTDASIVYETGEWSASKWKDAQAMGPGPTYVRIQWIEAFRRGK